MKRLATLVLLFSLLFTKGNEMKLGDVMAKLGRGVLTRSEIDFLQQEMNKLQVVGSSAAGMFKTSESTPRFDTFYATSGMFDNVPTDAISLSYSEQSIDSGSYTSLSSSRTTSASSQFVYYNPAEPTRIYLNASPVKRLIIVSGWVAFDTNAVGARSAMIAFSTDTTDMYLAWLYLFTLTTVSGEVFHAPFCAALAVSPTYEGSINHFYLRAYQTSGGALNVSTAQLNIYGIK